MRSLLISIAVVVATSSPVLAKPKAVVAPLKGDADDKVGEVLREALADKLAVVPAKEVARTLDKLGVEGELDESDVQKLRQKTSASVVVHGKVGRAAGKKTLKVSVWVKGKESSDFTVQYKSTASESFRDGVRDALAKRIGSVASASEDEGKPRKKKFGAVASEDEAKDKDSDKPRKKKVAAASEDEAKDKDTDKPRKKKFGAVASEDEAKDTDKPRKKKVAAASEDEAKDEAKDTDKPRKKKVASAEDSDKPRKKKAGSDGERKSKKRVALSDEDRPRKRRNSVEGDGPGVSASASSSMAAPAAVRVDAGMFAGVRRLTYGLKAGGAMAPPTVGTPATAGRIQAEIYPFALSNRESKAAGFGITAEFEKTFGVSIDVPNSMGKSAPIDQGRYSVGAIYQIGLGKSALGLGVRYTGQHFIADRSGLGQVQLDAPDVDYTAIAPGAALRVRMAPKLSLFFGLDAKLVLSTGSIQKSDSYGAANVFGLGGNSGLDIRLGKSVGLRLAAEYSQFSFSFKGTGALATGRGVDSATDRTFGVASTLAAMF